MFTRNGPSTGPERSRKQGLGSFSTRWIILRRYLTPFLSHPFFGHPSFQRALFLCWTTTPNFVGTFDAQEFSTLRSGWRRPPSVRSFLPSRVEEPCLVARFCWSGNSLAITKLAKRCRGCANKRFARRRRVGWMREVGVRRRLPMIVPVASALRASRRLLRNLGRHGAPRRGRLP